MWRTWFIIHRAKHYSRAVTSCNTHHFGWRIWAPCNVANFQSVLHMLALTCDMELVPGLRDLKTSLLIRHPDEEVGTVPFSFDSDPTLQRICDRLVYQYFEDHIIDAKLFQCQRVWLSAPMRWWHITIIGMSKKCSFQSQNHQTTTLANSTHIQTPNRSTLFIVQIKNHRGIILAREARRTKTTPSHAFMSLFDSYFDHYYSSSAWSAETNLFWGSSWDQRKH